MKSYLATMDGEKGVKTATGERGHVQKGVRLPGQILHALPISSYCTLLKS